MWFSTVVVSVVFPGPEFAWGCTPVPRADRLCASEKTVDVFVDYMYAVWRWRGQINKETSSAKSPCHLAMVVQECHSMREDVVLLPICTTLWSSSSHRPSHPITNPQTTSFHPHSPTWVLSSEWTMFLTPLLVNLMTNQLTVLQLRSS